MKRSLAAALFVLVAACGAEDTSGPATTAGPAVTTTTSTTTLPGATQQELLAEARLVWKANRPDSYEVTYSLACECDGGPWFARVDGTEIVASGRIGPEVGGEAPYPSIDAIFDEIEATIAQDEFPVDVEYDQDFGYPRSYIFNEPELPVDGGFILTVTAFEANPSPGDPAARQAFEEALARWEDAGLADYDYTFTRGCFCPEEWIGPYQVAVRVGEIVRASFKGIDLFDVEMLEIGRYDEIIKTVPALFDEVERALREADSFTAEYHPRLGYPANVYIDWIANAADEEVSYSIEGLREPIEDLKNCSTTGLDIVLEPQPELPEPVAETRRAIFEAAMDCDVAVLAAMTNGPDGFSSSFESSDPPLVQWYDAERSGDGVLLRMVQHLNLDYIALAGDESQYTWPSAFPLLKSADGTGLSSEEYAKLLSIYPIEDLDEMFVLYDSYAGYRIGISGSGQWLYALQPPASG